MNNFDYYSPTKILFGRGKINLAGAEIRKYGTRILLAYGEGSIKNNGVYQEVVSELTKHGINYVELIGIKPNPSIESVREGVKLCRDHKLEFILAVGGGSVIDCCKAIAAGMFYEGDPWDFYSQGAKIRKALPMASVLTLSATGSEMNGGSVISNEETEEKLPFVHDMLRPVFSVLDPAYTFSVSAYQTAAGTADIMSHCIEQYFSLASGTFVQDRITESIIQTCIHFGPIALKEPENYEARANLMWASSLALTGIIRTGKEGDWATHYIEHKISAVSDLTHGIGLAIITPHWMREVMEDNKLDKFITFAENVLGVQGNLTDKEKANQGIHAMEDFFRSMNIPASLKEAGVLINDEKLISMSEELAGKNPIGNFKKLDKSAVLRILRACI